jgi:uncharacterized membrane protein
MELWRLLAHQHWFALRVRDLELRLCARCSGYIAGLLSLMVIKGVIDLSTFQLLPVQNQLFICALFTMPSVLDWLTHSWGLRESNNALRFATGTILGVAVSLFSSITLMPDLIPLSVSAMFAIAIMGLLGKPKRRMIDQ